MTAIPFDRRIVSRGDLLVLACDGTTRLMFKFMAHGGMVVATWLEPHPDGPRDAILLQRDVRMLR